MASLPGVRFATCSETEKGGHLDENLIKLLTGEDSVRARLLYKEGFDFKPEAKICILTNNRPVIRGTGNDIWRRVIMIPFNQVVPEGPKLHFKEKLQAELEGIFAWMVRGYLDYVKNGLYKAPVVEEDKDEYRKEQDVIEQFFLDQCDFGPGLSAGREDLYKVYVRWCDGPIKRRVLSIAEFKKELLSERFKDRIEEKQLYVSVEGNKKKRQEVRWKGVATKISKFLADRNEGEK